METVISKPYYLARLSEEFSRRQRKNAAFSLRAYARFLKIQPPTLSAVLKGKRPLPFRIAEAITKKLELSPREREEFLTSIYYQKASIRTLQLNEVPRPGKVLLDEKYFAVIAEWEHYAILSLMDTRGFKSDLAWIARRLGISKTRAESALQRLVDTGLVEHHESSWKKTNTDVRTTEDVVSTALQRSHKEAMQMGTEKLESVPVKLRDFSSTTIAVNLEKLTEAKALIRTFRRKISELLEDGESSEVFQLSVQLYPLTEPEAEKEKEKI